jgi:hypothetical protein
MPVISRDSIGFDSPNGFVRFMKIVKYSTKQQMFTIELPEWMKPVLDAKEARAETQAGVEREFKKLCDAYKESVKKTKKVIAYIVQMTGTAKKGKGDDYTVIKKWDDISFFNGDFALGLGYVVLNETELNGKKTYRTLRDSYFNVTDDHKIIPWTQEAENFFENANNSLQSLMLKLDAFFSDEEKVLEAIQTTKNLLPFKD